MQNIEISSLPNLAVLRFLLSIFRKYYSNSPRFASIFLHLAAAGKSRKVGLPKFLKYGLIREIASSQ